MGGLTLLEEARGAGLSVTAAGDRLIIRGPRQADGIARELLARKAEVLAFLAPPKAQPPGVPRAQLTQREIAWETLAVQRWGPAQDDPTAGIDSKAPSRTGPPLECASDPEARAEREAIPAEGMPFAQEPSLAPPSPHRVPPSPDARIWRCRRPNCSAGWWQAPGGIIRCRRCEGFGPGWWIDARGALANAPWVAPFRLRTTDPPRWRIEPWREVPIRFGPAGFQRAVKPPESQDPGWIQDPEEETFEE